MTMQNVTKTFKGGRGVRDISFTLEAGRITALVGSNGAGKSTIIKLLTNLLKPDSGEIMLRDVRFMPDDIAFPDTLTAEEIIAYLGKLKKIPQAEQQAMLEKVGLVEAKKLKVGQFSKGMRQRLNLAQSLMGTGELFILDEPTNGLDPYWIAQLKALLEAERARGQMILFSTHLLSLAEEIADQVIMIHHGEIIASGTIVDLLTTNNCKTLEQLWLQLTKQEVQS
ncbi:MAG: ABC transporter ATP-binding protein [Solibacillus sp.]